jgi:hypothetical protein
MRQVSGKPTPLSSTHFRPRGLNAYENNNALKIKGYPFEHNYGHGKQPLSSLLATLILLAYLTHSVLEWVDDNYRLLRPIRAPDTG